jgi:hypothetical protein
MLLHLLDSCCHYLTCSLLCWWEVHNCPPPAHLGVARCRMAAASPSSSMKVLRPCAQRRNSSSSHQQERVRQQPGKQNLATSS